MVSSDFSSLFIVLFLIIILIYVNERYNDVIVKLFKDIVLEVERFLKGYSKEKISCFPKSCLPIYKCQDDCLDPPCLEPYDPKCDSNKTCPQNVINVNCGTTTSTDNSCFKPKCVDFENNCEDLCKNNNKIQFGCYCYVISYLPGIIFKYKLDSQGKVDEDSRTEITHALGSLKRIYIENEIIYVEDSNSIIHPGTFNPLDGSLTF